MCTPTRITVHACTLIGPIFLYADIQTQDSDMRYGITTLLIYTFIKILIYLYKRKFLDFKNANFELLNGLIKENE